MAEDYGQLWKDIAETNSQNKAVQGLTKILADQRGRHFVSCLGREDAKLCMEILDRASRALPFLPNLVVSYSFARASQTINLKALPNRISSFH